MSRSVMHGVIVLAHPMSDSLSVLVAATLRGWQQTCYLLRGRGADHVDRALAVLAVGLRRRRRPTVGTVAGDVGRIGVADRVGRVARSHAAADGDGVSGAGQRSGVAVSELSAGDNR